MKQYLFTTKGKPPVTRDESATDTVLRAALGDTARTTQTMMQLAGGELPSLEIALQGVLMTVTQLKPKRFRNALAAHNGASNALAVANGLVEAIQEARNEGADWNCTGDPAIKLIAYQLMFLVKASELNDALAYDRALTDCEARTQ